MNADVQPYKMIYFTDVESRECCHNRVKASKSRSLKEGSVVDHQCSVADIWHLECGGGTR